MKFNFTPPPEDFDLEAFNQWVRDRLASASWNTVSFDLDRDIKPGWKEAPHQPCSDCEKSAELSWSQFMSQVAMDGLVDEQPEDE